MHFIVTGGAGYLGGIMAITLHRSGHKVSIIDNFSNSQHSSFLRIQEITGDLNGERLSLENLDICDTEKLNETFDYLNKEEPIEAVFHFAGLKSVSESIEHPNLYFKNNIHGTLNVLNAMENIDCNKFIFSSSATVYKEKESGALLESDPLGPINPYGESKLMSEKHLETMCKQRENLSVAILRYFNPVGADSSGMYGENPNGTPNNLMPFVFDVAIGKRPYVSVFGDDYDTKDGTGVRDYIHVEDLIQGHISAYHYLKSHIGSHIFNLGSGHGYSVLEMINEVRKETRNDVPYRVAERRNGDIGEVIASTEKAHSQLGWKAEKTLNDMISSQWGWHQHLHS